MAKAVSDTVDRGKKEVDQFMRVQKVKGEIGQVEQRIQEAATQVQQIKLQVGEKAIAMLQAGTLTAPELQALVAPMAGIERDIEAHRATIVEKHAEIVRIEAEGRAPAVPPAASAAPPIVPPATPPQVSEPALDAAPPAVPPFPGDPHPPITAPPPLPAPSERVCLQCGAKIASNAAFCTECGAKIG
jgi:hypothetical protein